MLGQAVQETVTPAMIPMDASDQIAFLQALANLDRAMTASPLSLIQFTGEAWQVSEVELVSGQSGLSVRVAADMDADGGSETLQELRRRLEARGLGDVAVVKSS